MEQLDRIDALVANAGTTARSGALELSVEEWQRVLDLNLTPVFVLAQAAARKWSRRAAGDRAAGVDAVVHRRLQRVGLRGIEGRRRELAKALSNELAGRGVRVNAIAPGYVETDMTSTIEDWRRKEIDERIRWAASPSRPSWPVIAFLLSDDARYVSGAVIPVDGGFSGR